MAKSLATKSLKTLCRQLGRLVAVASVASLCCIPAQAQVTTNIAPKSGASGAALEQILRSRLAQLGMSTCTETAVYVTMYLANKQSAAFHVEAVGGNAGRRPVYITMESVDPGFTTRYSSVFIGPNCDGVYTQSIRWAEDCRSVKAKYFARFSKEETLLRETTISFDGARQLTLTEINEGCLSTKVEPFLR